jgi:hypothetical protein
MASTLEGRGLSVKQGQAPTGTIYGMHRQVPHAPGTALRQHYRHQCRHLCRIAP